jgi:hypothetical protein
MDYAMVGTVLWIVAGFLTVASVLGVGLALVLDRGPASPSAEVSLPAKAGLEAAVVAEAPPPPVDEKVLASRKAAYRRGILVLLGLAVLTALEFWVAAAAGGSTVFLFIIVLAKAGLILQYYMHLGQLWGEEEAHG